VAHMPWRQMTYKFLNTIIDDLFAFVIKMPALHRLSVFRDGTCFIFAPGSFLFSPFFLYNLFKLFPGGCENEINM
jgi:hypothetical protein